MHVQRFLASYTALRSDSTILQYVEDGETMRQNVVQDPKPPEMVNED